jgi:hypothetical protein
LKDISGDLTSLERERRPLERDESMPATKRGTHMPRRAPARTGEGGEPQAGAPPAAAGDEQQQSAAAGTEPDAGDELENDEDHLDLVQQLLPARVQAALKLKPDFAQLLAEACYVFGINPDPALKPRELAAYRVDPGDPDGVPAVPVSVVLVTAGGLKVRYPIDDDTENRLRLVYGAYKVNRATGEREVLPLPEDLTLPRANVDGVVRSDEHVYRTGYLREGGKEAAARKAKLRELRADQKIR